MTTVVTPKPMSSADKTRLKKVLQCLSDDDYRHVKEAAQEGHVDKAIDAILNDYLAVLDTSVNIVNAIYEYKNRFERVKIVNLTEETQRAKQKQKDLAFSQSLGAWPSQTDSPEDTSSLKTSLDLRSFQTSGLSLQPL